jgi:hypothetical protein
LAIADKSPHANPVPIQAIQDYFSATSPAWTQVPSPSDDIVTESSQSIAANLLNPSSNSNASLVDLPIPYNLPSGWLTDSSDVSQTLACWEPGIDPSLPLLHFMTCLGALTEVQFTIGTQLINDTVPWISAWTVAPATLSLGGSVTIEYTAADYSTFQLSRAELWRAPNAGGQPGAWSELSFQTITGNGPTQVIFTDTPEATGSYWYGTHLFDTGGNEALEPSTAQVTVSTPPTGNTTPTVLVTPLLSSITTAQSLTTVVGVGGPNGEPTPTGSVTLASGSYSSAPTPLSSGGATIVVPAGSLLTGTDTLTVAYTPDAASSSVYTSASGSTNVTVSPASTAPTISGFTATPANVSGGWTITYTVTLTSGAPTGGAQISFTSSTPSIIPNANIEMPAGSTSGQTTVVAQNPASVTPVVITASFNGSSKQATITVTPSSIATYLVTVQVFGAGDVTSQDGRLVCVYSNCSAVYTVGSTISLSEVPGLNYAFSGWGQACSGQGVCSFTVTNNMLVTATFSPIPGTVDSDLITVVVGNGTISSTDGLVNCSTNCQTFYPNTASVILNAVPNLGYEFGGWTGACTGLGQCSLALPHITTVQATFSATAGTTTMAVSPGTIQTITGNGTAGSTGDGGPTSLASLNNPLGLAADRQGNLYIAEFNGNRIRVSNTQANPITVGNITVPPGSIATLAGNGTAGFSGDGGPSTAAQIYGPTAVRLDTSGNLYFADADNNRIRVINLQTTPITIAGVTIQPGAIMTVAGNGTYGYTGDGVPATSAGLTNPQDVLVDGSGNIYIAEWSRVRLVNAQTGIISTFAGGGSGSCTSQLDGVGDGCLATQASVYPIALAIDSFGNIFLTDELLEAIRMVYKGGAFPGLPSSPTSGYIYALAGRGSGCSGQVDAAGDGCPVFDSAAIVGVGLSVDPAGSLYFANLNDSRIHRVDRATGILTALAGNGTSGYLQDGVPATSTEVSFNGWWYGSVLAMDSAGNLYFSDTNTNRVREVTSAGAQVPLSSASVGSQGTGVSILVENIGTSTMNQPVIAISGTNAAEFSESDTCSSSVQPGASCTITALFTPAATGTRYAQLSITSSNSQNSPQTLELTGNEVGAEGVLSLGTASLSFGNQVLGTTSAAQSIVITNSGTADLAAPAVSISGSNTNEFSSTNTCQGGIKTGANCVVGVTFTPLATGSASANLSIIDYAASNSPQSVSLSGTGAQTVPLVTWSPSISALTYGQMLGAGVLDATASANGSTLAGTFGYTAVVGVGAPQTILQSTVLGAGTYTLTANFSPADTTDYAPASASTQLKVNPASLSLAAGNASISYGAPLPNFTYSMNGFVNGDTAATATSGAPSLTTTATAGSPVGSYPITPSVGTLIAANYSIAFVPATLTITQASQTITFGTLPNQAFGVAPFGLTATASSGLAVSFATVTPAVCTVSGTNVTVLAVGSCTIQATQAGSSNYTSATPVNQSFQVTKASQTITFGPLVNQSYGTPPFTVSATATSGLPVSFASTTTTICTASGNTVTLAAVGKCTIRATQAGNVDYATATPVSQSLQVTKASETITFGPLANQPYGTSFTVSATASSGLPVTFASTTTTICTVSGDTVAVVSVGRCTIRATQAGNIDYAAATPVSQSFQVTKATQTITFGLLTNQPYGTPPFTVSATASSGLPVSFASTTTTICTVSGNTVTLMAVGECTIRATQAGNLDYATATPVSQSFTVTKASQAITFGPLPTKPLGAAPFAISAMASSGLSVSFTSTTIAICTVSGDTVTLVAVGKCTIRATQAGNADYTAATPVNQSFQVTH